jgi:hypothetical protein
MGAVDTDGQDNDFRQLHRQLEESDDIRGVLGGLTRHAASSLSRAAAAQVACAVTLRRHQKTATIAGSSEKAVLLDRIEQDLAHGPSLEALHTFTPVLLADTRADTRWPLYSRNLTAAGYGSVLGVPIDLGETASAALNFFAPAAGVFTDEVISEAVGFSHTAGHALRVALHNITAALLAGDLRAAMESRTDIDLATGMIMTQNKWTQEQAFQFLLMASNNRNMKLHLVAREIIGRPAGSKQTTTHFED